MGFLDKIFGKENVKTVKKDDKCQSGCCSASTPIEEPIEEPIKEPIKSSLNLEKKIGLNFEKMGLNDPETLKKRLFILDVSGSMSETVDKERKIDHLKNIMKKYPDANMMTFSIRVSFIKKASDIPEPQSSTNLAYALECVKDNKTLSPERLVLISDGEPDSKQDAFAEAIKLGLPIDIIFIGRKGSDGDLFMEELAKKTNGSHFVV